MEEVKKPTDKSDLGLEATEVTPQIQQGDSTAAPLEETGELGVKVTDYLNYRSFLNAYFLDARRRNPRLSYGSWARRLNVKDTSTLTKILRGQRHPGPKVIDNFIQYFKFDSKDSGYFRNMVMLERYSNEPSVKLQILESLGRENPQAAKTVIDEKAFGLISNWYGFAIRSLINVKGFTEDLDWIAKKLMFLVSPKAIQTTLNHLLELGLVVRNAAGALVSTEASIHTTNDISSEFIKKHHEEMLDNAKRALRMIGVEKREFTSATITFDSSRVAEAKQLIRKFKSDFENLFESSKNSSGDSVYQIQVQFFPLTTGVE